MHRVAQMVDVMIGETSAAGALGPLRAHTLRLSNGVEIPGVGFGIGSKENVIHALEQGYTHLDTARVYGGGQCEVDIGEVMASDKWPRASVFVTTKTSSYGPADNTYMWDVSSPPVSRDWDCPTWTCCCCIGPARPQEPRNVQTR
jgi:hypothetical protein